MKPLGRQRGVLPAGDLERDDVPLNAFEALYRAEWHRLVRVAYLLVGDREVARDVVQDAFVRVHGRWASVREPEAYLRRAVVNGCHSTHRRRSTERSNAPRLVAIPTTELGHDDLADAVAALPHRQRAAIVLRFYADLTEADIAAAIGCRPGTVGPLIHRGLTRLREVIER